MTRYFGGILLGAGGLTRAYSKGAKDALIASGVAVMGAWARVEVPCTYPLFERVKLEIEGQSGVIDDVAYGADVVLSISLPAEKAEALQARLTELSAREHHHPGALRGVPPGAKSGSEIAKKDSLTQVRESFFHFSTPRCACFLMAWNDSSLITCSSLQASSAATSGDTPSRVRYCVSSV